MKRILILNPYLPTLGGGEKYMGYLCLFLETYYPDVTIDILIHNYLGTNIHDKNFKGLDELTKRFGLTLEKTNILKIDLISSTSVVDRYRNKAVIEKLSSKYDIFINLMFLSKHAGKAKKNIYISMFPPTKYISLTRNFFKTIAWKYIDQRFYRSYDRFIPISDYSDQWLKKYWGENYNYKIIQPPVFWENDVVGNYDEDSKENIILSVGRFFVSGHSKKQLDMVKFFINNFDKFSNYELHLVGGLSNNQPDTEYVETIKSIIGNHPVHIHTNAKTECVASLYKKAKVFWHAAGFGENLDAEPLKAEHFGITTVEAMSYGAVPIVINVGGQPEIVDEAINGYVWNNENECINKTVKLIANEQIRKEMASCAAEKAKTFSVEAFFKRNRELFDGL